MPRGEKTSALISFWMPERCQVPSWVKGSSRSAQAHKLINEANAQLQIYRYPSCPSDVRPFSMCLSRLCAYRMSAKQCKKVTIDFSNSLSPDIERNSFTLWLPPAFPSPPLA